MKKITFFLTFAAVMAIFFEAKADLYKYRPYIGAGYVYNRTSALGHTPKYHTADIHVGSTYSDYFATELFFNQSSRDKSHIHNTKIKSSYRSYGLDLVAKLPLGCEKSFALLATAGIGEYVFRPKVQPQKHHNEHGYGYRFGGGAQYAITNHWQTRFLTRYVSFDHVNGFDHDVEYTISVEYLF